MTPIRVPVLRAPVLVLGLVLGLAAGCGGPEAQRADYCATLKHDQARLSEVLGASEPTALLQGLPLLERVAADAPRDLTDEWQTFLNALHGLDDALDDAGVQPDDFRDGRAPAGLPAAQRRAIAAAASDVADPAVVDAASGIEQQARDVCKIPLGM